MKYKFLLILLIYSIFFSQLYSQTAVTKDELLTTIKFENEKVYYLNSPIRIKIEITNNSTDLYFLEIAEDLSFNVDFRITSEIGETVKYSKYYILAKAVKEKIFAKPIQLSPFQSISYTIDISKWFDFKQSGNYYIQGVFLTSLSGATTVLSNNVLRLQLNPSLDSFPSKEAQVRYENAKLFQMTTLKDAPPYKIVEMALNARAKRNFELYFSFFDFDTYIPQYSKFKNKYMYSSEKTKLQIIEQFKGERVAELKESDLIHFEIQKVIIEKEEAVVYLYMEYRYKNMIEKFLADYYLILRNQIWLIKGYILVPQH